MQTQLALGAVVLLVLALAIFTTRRRGDSGPAPERQTAKAPARKRAAFAGGGPYNIQLYDSPRYYPYYEARDYAAALDRAGRCSVACSASGDGGCAVACR